MFTKTAINFGGEFKISLVVVFKSINTKRKDKVGNAIIFKLLHGQFENFKINFVGDARQKWVIGDVSGVFAGISCKVRLGRVGMAMDGNQEDIFHPANDVLGAVAVMKINIKNPNLGFCDRFKISPILKI